MFGWTIRLRWKGQTIETDILPAVPLSVMPGLDPGTSQRKLTGGLQAEVLMSPAHLLKGGTGLQVRV
jgi:hypothetical protein